MGQKAHIVARRPFDHAAIVVADPQQVLRAVSNGIRAAIASVGDADAGRKKRNGQRHDAFLELLPIDGPQDSPDDRSNAGDSSCPPAAAKRAKRKGVRGARWRNRR